MKKIYEKILIAGILLIAISIGSIYMISTADKEYVYSEDLTFGQIYDASSWQSTTPPQEAFDNSIFPSNSWYASNAGNNEWVSVEFDEPKHIGQLKLEFSSSPGNTRNFKLQGFSNSEWNDIYTGVCENSLSRWHVFEFENREDYNQYRVFVIDIYPVGSTSTISIAEIEMIEIDTEYDIFGKTITLDGMRT